MDGGEGERQDLVTNALAPNKFELYDSGTQPLRDVIGVDVSRSVRGNLRSQRSLRSCRRERER